MNWTYCITTIPLISFVGFMRGCRLSYIRLTRRSRRSHCLAMIWQRIKCGIGLLPLILKTNQ